MFLGLLTVLYHIEALFEVQHDTGMPYVKQQNKTCTTTFIAKTCKGTSSVLQQIKTQRLNQNQNKPKPKRKKTIANQLLQKHSTSLCPSDHSSSPRTRQRVAGWQHVRASAGVDGGPGSLCCIGEEIAVNQPSQSTRIMLCVFCSLYKTSMKSLKRMCPSFFWMLLGR